MNKVFIGLTLSGIIVLGLVLQVRNAQVLKRDSKRKQDLKNLQTQIGRYCGDFRRYPSDLSLPPDPYYPLHYFYKVSKDGSEYQLFARLENTKDKDIVWGLDANCGAMCNYVVEGK